MASDMYNLSRPTAAGVKRGHTAPWVAEMRAKLAIRPSKS